MYSNCNQETKLKQNVLFSITILKNIIGKPKSPMKGFDYYLILNIFQ